MALLDYPEMAGRNGLLNLFRSLGAGMGGQTFPAAPGAPAGGLGAQAQAPQPMMPPQQTDQPRGLFGGLSRFNENHPGFLMGAGSVVAGKDLSPAYAYSMGAKKDKKAQAAEARKNNATKQWLIGQGYSPEEAQQIVDSGAAGSFLKPKKGMAGDGVSYSKDPVFGTDPKTGKTVLGTIGDDGSFKKIDTGDFDVAAGIDKIDAGTHWLLYDKRTGRLVGQEPKDLRGAEREKGIGEAEGKAAASAPGDFQAGQIALDLIDQIRTNPALETGTGFSSKIWNWLPGSSGYDFQNLVDQAKSGAFLTAVQQMRGLGALSNVEGSAATQAITRMNTATSKEAFLQALADYEAIVMQGMENARNRGANSGVNMPPAGGGAVPGAPSGGNQRLRYNPQTGELE